MLFVVKMYAKQTESQDLCVLLSVRPSVCLFLIDISYFAVLKDWKCTAAFFFQKIYRIIMVNNQTRSDQTNELSEHINYTEPQGYKTDN